MQTFTDACLEALASGTTYPSALASMPELSLEDAYTLQRHFVAARTATDPIVGFKAALTAPPPQQAMGIDRPILGALLASHAMQPGQIVAPAGGLLETELGHRLSAAVRAPVTADEVQDLVGEVHVMVELAQPRLSGKPAGLDLIATNSAAFGFVAGPVLTADIPLDDVEAALLDTSGTTLFGAPCGTVMGGQREALTWLINTALALGYELEAGHLLMTGSVGGAAPARPGAYQARFTAGDALNETIAFELTAA